MSVPGAQGEGVSLFRGVLCPVRAVFVQEGSLSEGISVQGGLCPEQDICLESVSIQGVSVQRDGDTPIPCEQTDRCKNITFPCG